MTTFGEERTKAQVEYDRSVYDRVMRGIERLQEEYGEGWVEKIDPKSLQLADGSSCVLGQIYEDYGQGQDALGIDDEEAEELGFFSSCGSYKQLDAAWQDAIAAYSRKG